MATRVFSTSLFTKQHLTSLLSRSFTSLSTKSPSSSLSSLSRLRPISAVALNFSRLSPTVRCFATRQTTSSLNDSSPNWSNRPPKETILLDGCDFEHWLVVMEKPEGDPTRDEIIDSYIKKLATVVDSEQEARMKIYSVSTRHYYAFGALISEELSYKMKGSPYAYICPGQARFAEIVYPRLEKNYVKDEVFRIIEATAACVRHLSAKRPRMSQDPDLIFEPMPVRSSSHSGNQHRHRRLQMIGHSKAAQAPLLDHQGHLHGSSRII